MKSSLNNLPQIQAIAINALEANAGQMDGLPANPRKIEDPRFELLVESIKNSPEFLNYNPLKVYPLESGKFIVIGGNMRFLALTKLGFKLIPCIIIPEDTPTEKLKEYVHQLAVKYDTYGSERDFRTAEGNMIKVKGGDYGWVIYEEKEVEALRADIEAGREVIREPEYLYRGYDREENDIGDTYVEVDLTKQRMCFYLNGTLLVDTPVVTGTQNKKYATPTGVYALDNKKSPAVLKGEDYASPVTYWMPFKGNSVGLHDASWQSAFGGNRYATGYGSHGCINLPIGAAAELYGMIEPGDVVVVHY